MADKKLVEAITSMDEDFAQWYTDVVIKAELIDYTSVKGCMVIKPAGYAIWERIQQKVDSMFKETGVENVYLPMFICPRGSLGYPWRSVTPCGKTLCKTYIRDSFL